jgi:hypothetical protein
MRVWQIIPASSLKAGALAKMLLPLMQYQILFLSSQLVNLVSFYVTPITEMTSESYLNHLSFNTDSVQASQMVIQLLL